MRPSRLGMRSRHSYRTFGATVCNVDHQKFRVDVLPAGLLNLFHHIKTHPLTLLIFSLLSLALALRADTDVTPLFQDALSAPWQNVFEDSGHEAWPKKWSLDGRRARIENTEEGLYFESGPIAKEHASHAVLWTQQTFQGDLKVEFDYTRMDTVNSYVCIVYLYATGIGEAPYSEDISHWSQLRQIPYMSTYFNHMNLLHISFAAFDNSPEIGKESSYVRARRYPRSLFDGSFDKMAIPPDYTAIGLFEPGIKHHIIVIKRHSMLFMQVTNTDGDSRLFHWNLSNTPDLDYGRFGIRQMCQRAALFSNVSISQISTSDGE